VVSVHEGQVPQVRRRERAAAVMQVVARVELGVALLRQERGAVRRGTVAGGRRASRIDALLFLPPVKNAKKGIIYLQVTNVSGLSIPGITSKTSKHNLILVWFKEQIKVWGKIKRSHKCVGDM
jgi:hypothetical protein